MSSKNINNSKIKLIRILKENNNYTINELKTRLEINDIHLKDLLVSILFEQMTTSTLEEKFVVDYKLCRKIMDLLSRMEYLKDHRIEKIKSMKLLFEKATEKYDSVKKDNMFEFLLDVIKDMTPQKFEKLKNVITSVIKNDISNYYLIQSLINIYIYYQYYDNSAVTDIFYLEKMIKELSLNYNGDKEKILSYLSNQQDKFKKQRNGDKEYDQITKYSEKLRNVLRKKVNLSKRLYIGANDDHFYIPDYSVLSKLESNNNEFLDLREIPTITFDPKGTICFDDACSIDIKENGNYLINIYISNVSDFIKFGTITEKKAYLQGETNYRSPNKKTMLPPEMSYNRFTLKEGEDREVIAYMYELTPKYELVDFKVKRGLINVNKNIYFSDTDKNIYLNKYNDSYKILDLVSQVSRGLLCNKDNFEFTHNIKFFHESTINSIGNNYGIIIPVLKSLIEYSTYNYFARKDLPYIYRVQTDYEKRIGINELQREWAKRKDLNKVFEYIVKNPLPNHYISTFDNEFEDVIYCLNHNSSPIRRYSSFVAQKLVIAFMIDQKEFDQKFINKLKNQLDMISNYLNVNKNINVDEIDNFVKTKTIH